MARIRLAIGDMVVGNIKAARYSFTVPGWKGIVVNTLRGGVIEVKDLTHSVLTYAVDEECFDLLKPATRTKSPGGGARLSSYAAYDPIKTEWEDDPGARPKRIKKPEPVLDLNHLDSLVIEPTVKEEIASVLKQHKNHKKLFVEWGLGETIEYGKAMSFMFWGEPGTGKTWAATCIAKALGTELMTISAAEIQSSEPGAANRNIQNAFSEAKTSKKVLFLDECDSLIANRAELGMVLAGEVNTLLTEIEKFDGVIILATNRIAHMDAALERRISLIAEFPMPDVEQRKGIWKKLLPEKMPIGKDVSVDDLAKERLSGGQIKNVILQAARLAAASEAKSVDNVHFAKAMERVLSSKGLMGTEARTRQGFSDGMGIGRSSNPQVTRTISSYLDKELAEDNEEDHGTH